MQINLMLSALLASLLIGAGVELAPTARATDGAPPVTAVPPQSQTGAVADVGSTAALSESILARPLFTEGRRPAAPVVAAAAQARLEKPPRLTGILVTGNDRRAIFDSSGKPVVGTVGTQMGAYRILAITPLRVTLQGPGGPLGISLNYGVNEAPAPSAKPGTPDELNAAQRLPDGLPRVPTFQDMMANLPKSNPPMLIGGPQMAGSPTR